MLREPKWLKGYAQLVSSDLTNTLDGSWTCTVSDELILRVIGPAWDGVAEIDEDVDEDEEFDPDAYPELLADRIDADASTAVVGQVVELLGNTQRDWPVCPTHGAQLEVAGNSWQCSDLDHNPIPIGQLGVG